MAGIRELKSKLAAKTELLSRTIDPIERTYLGGDIRELERLVELTSDEPPDPPRYRWA